MVDEIWLLNLHPDGTGQWVATPCCKTIGARFSHPGDVVGAHPIRFFREGCDKSFLDMDKFTRTHTAAVLRQLCARFERECDGTMEGAWRVIQDWGHACWMRGTERGAEVEREVAFKKGEQDMRERARMSLQGLLDEIRGLHWTDAVDRLHRRAHELGIELTIGEAQDA